MIFDYCVGSMRQKHGCENENMVKKGFTGPIDQFIRRIYACTSSYIGFRCKNINFEYFSVGFQNLVENDRDARA